MLKKEVLKSNKGITLISLVITLTVLAIIASISIHYGLESIEESKSVKSITELKMIQDTVNAIYEKRKLSDENLQYYNSVGKDLSNVDSTRLQTVLGNTEEEGFKYFDSEELKKLDLDLDRKVIINMDTREVIDLSGIRVNEEVFYKLGDIPGYEFYAVEYVNKNNEGPTFNVIISKINSVWKITIDNIEYNSNVTESTLSYKLSTSDNWINMGNSKIFTVTETGEYDIKLTDAAGNETIIKKQIG